MARFEITSPEGKRFEVTAPDGASQEDVMRFVQQQGTQATQPDKPELGLDYTKPMGQLRNDISALPEESKQRAYKIWADKQVAKERQGPFPALPNPTEGIPIIGGLLDEIGAGGLAALYAISNGKLGHPYEEGLALERARFRQANEANPALAVTGQLAAGLATAAPIVGAIRPAATLAGRIGQGAAIGAPLAAAEGFTRGEGSFGERLDAAETSALQGGAIGAALPVAGSLVTRGFGAARDFIAPTVNRLRFGPDEAADEILAQRIAREGSSAAAKRLDLQRGQAQAARLNSNSYATLPETIADTSDDMRRLTGSLYRQGGEAGNFVEQRLSARQRGPENAFAPEPAGPPQGQRARVMDAAERAMLIRSSDTARRTEAQIMREQAAEGQRLYEQAYDNSSPFDLSVPLQAMGLRIQQYPRPFAAKLERARNLFVRSGTAQNQPWWVDDVRRFDASKKALDDMIDSAQRGGQNNLARELTQFKNALLEHVHAPDASGAPTINLAYQEARQAWGSAAENREAIELGRSALREGSEVSVEQYADLSRGQRQLFRMGFLESLRNALGTKRPGNDITQLFQQARVQELMREIIPRSQGQDLVFTNRPERFGELLNREQRMVRTNTETLGNSKTEQRAMDDMNFAGSALSNMWNRFRSSPSLFNVGVEAVGAVIQKTFAFKQDVALALARRLLETDPQARNQILRRLARRGGPNVFARFADEVDRASNATAAAVQPLLAQSQSEGGAR